MQAKKTLVQNLTFMALMAAINVIASIISMLEPFFSLPFMLVLPLVSTLVAIYCQNKYLLIYLASSLIVVTLSTLSNLGNTLFYIIPAIITGTLFGYLIKKKMSLSMTILIGACVQLILTYVGLVLVELVLDQDFIFILIKVLGQESNPSMPLIIPSAIFILSLVQTVLSLFIIIEQLPKLKIVVNEEINDNYSYISLALFVLSGFLPLFLEEIAYLSFSIAMYISIALVIHKIIKKRRLYVYLTLILIPLIVPLIALFNSLIPQAYIVLLTGFPFAIIDIVIIIDYYLRSCHQSSKIN